jgi:hypothetical protein
VVEFFDDGDGAPPGAAGGTVIASAAVGITEVRMSIRFLMSIADFIEEVEGVLVADDCVGVLVEGVMSVAQAVPRIGFA